MMGFLRLRVIIDLEFCQFPDIFALCDLNDFVHCQLTEKNPMIAAAENNSLKQSWNVFDEFLWSTITKHDFTLACLH
jgi:hypothetical protein